LIHWQDDFDASRLLIPEIFYRLNISGNPIVAMINRNNLLVTGDKDIKNINRLVDIVTEQLPIETNPLSGLTLRHKQHNQSQDNQWLTFPHSAEIKPLLNLWNLNQKWRVNNYNSQLNSVRKLFNEYKVSTNVSEVYAIESKENGEIHTSCTWNFDSNYHTLLPKTDTISFVMNSKSEAMIIPWYKAFPII